MTGLEFLLVASAVGVALSKSLKRGKASGSGNQEGSGLPESEYKMWEKYGFTSSEASLWKSAGFTPQVAFKWKENGFSPEEARTFAELGCDIHNALKVKRLEIDLDELSLWVREGFSVSEAMEYISNGTPIDVAKKKELWVESNMDSLEI